MSLEFDIDSTNFAKIKVVGVGGAGNNAVNRMIEYGLKGAEFVAVNTDKQALFLSRATNRVQIGDKLTKGLGSGADPEVGRRAAEESHDELSQILRGADLIFIAAGLGGGTGTGAAPVIADIAKENEILTVAVVTKPFLFEGNQRMNRAERGFRDLLDRVDTIVTIPNDKLLHIVGKATPMIEAFRVADDVLRQGIQGITDLIAKPAMINLDFADVKTVMMEKGTAHMGIGIGHGENKTLDAAKQAIQSPMLDTNIEGARGILFNVTGDPTLSLLEVGEAAKLIQEAADPNANIFFGADTDPNLTDEVRITVIATGFGDQVTAAKTAEKTSPSNDWLSKLKSDDNTTRKSNVDPEKIIKTNIDVVKMEEEDELVLPIFLKDRRKGRE